MKAFHIELFKHHGQSYAAGGTSEHTDSIFVTDVVSRVERDGQIVYERLGDGLPEDMRCHTYRPETDYGMVLVERVNQRQEFGWVLYDYKPGDEPGAAVSGMFSGVWGWSSDSRWDRLVGGPVMLFDRHEYHTVYTRILTSPEATS